MLGHCRVRSALCSNLSPNKSLSTLVPGANGVGVETIRRDAVDGIGWDRDDLAALQQVNYLLQRVRLICKQNFCIHWYQDNFANNLN